MKLAIATIATIALLTGCATKEEGGALTGAVVGGILGSQVGGGSGRVVGGMVGAVAGAVIGGQIGRYMDAQDRLQAQRALETTRTGQSTTWKNPDTGNQYTVQPTKTTVQHNGQPCREYTTTAIIGGKQQQVYGTACRQADGSWKVK